jgi:drug/metabolite transporter (DMT)-like permease
MELFAFPPIVYVLFIVSAIGPSLIGHATYNYSMKQLPAFVVGVAILGEPIGATILAIFFFDRYPEPLSILYAGIILIGVVITSVSKNLQLYVSTKRRMKKEKEEEQLDS